MTERCCMHNPDDYHAAVYLVRVPIGNEIPLCEPCCAQWRADAEAWNDDQMRPVWIHRIPF